MVTVATSGTSRMVNAKTWRNSSTSKKVSLNQRTESLIELLKNVYFKIANISIHKLVVIPDQGCIILSVLYEQGVCFILYFFHLFIFKRKIVLLRSYTVETIHPNNYGPDNIHNDITYKHLLLHFTTPLLFLLSSNLYAMQI